MQFVDRAVRPRKAARALHPSPLMMLPLVTIAAAMSGGPTLNRRAMLGAAAAAFVATSPPAAAETPAVDFTTKSAFFGLAAPPVVGMLRYDELVEQARTGQIATLQIAVQHDTVIATDRMGHRFACMMRDEELPHLILDATGKDGSMPFEVLPMDEVRETHLHATSRRRTCTASAVASSRASDRWRFVTLPCAESCKGA